jgi:hypothetical protein
MLAGARDIVRDMGTAAAVLALYLLLLLAPWHQAAALQHDLADFGYAAVASVDICGDLAADTDGGATPLKCPIAGIGKFDFAGIVPNLLALDLPRRVEAMTYTVAPLAASPARRAGAQQPRAPPAAV